MNSEYVLQIELEDILNILDIFAGGCALWLEVNLATNRGNKRNFWQQKSEWQMDDSIYSNNQTEI